MFKKLNPMKKKPKSKNTNIQTFSQWETMQLQYLPHLSVLNVRAQTRHSNYEDCYELKKNWLLTVS